MSPCESPVFDALKARFRAGLKTRILAYGSSNTARRLPGMHWFDVLDLALGNTYGRLHVCLNTGIGGQTAGELLDRFDEDAGAFRPHLAFVTVGGNDSAPRCSVPEATFAANLRELHRRFARLGTAVVFKTYYAPLEELCRPEHLPVFYRFMEVVRAAAADMHAGLIDHLARWTFLRERHPAAFRRLMQDGLHVNRRGNAVIGLDVARAFDARVTLPAPASVEPDPSDGAYWDEALAVQALMDEAPAPEKRP